MAVARLAAWPRIPPTIACVETPIACSLDAASARSQLGEWRVLVERDVVRTERADEGRVVLVLRPGLDVGKVVDLAQREVACCPFFSFTLEIRDSCLALVVGAPAEASVLLDTLLGL